jgi:hypothetical protein
LEWLQEKPNAGNIQLGGNNVVMNYYEQNQADALDLEKTVRLCVCCVCVYVLIYVCVSVYLCCHHLLRAESG